MVDDFHLFLPSNTNPDICPDNTPSDYTTVYNENITLEGNWEVGVKSLSYPSKVDTFTGNEQIRSGKNLTIMIDGKYLNGDEEYYDFQTCIVNRPSSGLDEKTNRYKPEEVAWEINNCDFGKRGLLHVEYKKEKDVFIMDSQAYDCIIGMNQYLYFAVCNFPRLGRGSFQGIVAGGSMWSNSELPFGRYPGKDPWKLILFPLFRLEKEVITICGKDDGELTQDDILANLTAACKNRVKFQLLKDRRGRGHKLIVKSKPDVFKDKDYSVLHFNEAALYMLGALRYYYEPTDEEFANVNNWRPYHQYKDCPKFGIEPVQVTVWHRKIVNHSNFRPFWFVNNYDIPRKTPNDNNGLITFLNSFDKVKRKRNGEDYTFSIDKKTSHVVLTIKTDTYVRLDQVTADILGFKECVFYKKDTRYIADMRPRLDRAIYFLYVYNNFLTDSVYVGNVRAPLLCIIPHNHGATNAETFTQHFYNPTYIPVSKHSFNQLRITIRDDAGSIIPFSNAKTILGLHFRKRF